MASNSRKKSTGDFTGNGGIGDTMFVGAEGIPARRRFVTDAANSGKSRFDQPRTTTARQRTCRKQFIAAAPAIRRPRAGWLMRWIALKFFNASTLGIGCAWARSAMFLASSARCVEFVMLNAQTGKGNDRHRHRDPGHERHASTMTHFAFLRGALFAFDGLKHAGGEIGRHGRVRHTASASLRRDSISKSACTSGCAQPGPFSVGNFRRQTSSRNGFGAARFSSCL